MRKRLTAAVLAATFTVSAAFPATAATGDLLDGLPDDIVAGALVRQDGAGAAAGPVTADAHFRIGSVTKVFTNTVVLQLVAEHRVDVDAPARRYVPGLLPSQYDGITVRQLLNHTSGLPKPAATPSPADGPGWWLRSVPPRDALRDSFAAATGTPPAPGSEQQYNGLNSLVLGLLVEELTGHSYAHELEWRIIRPLRLRHTSLPAADNTTIPSPHARVYVNGDEVTEQSPYPWAEGGVISTAADLDRFLVALFRGRLLPPAQQKLLFEVPDVPGAATNTRYCFGTAACFSAGSLMRYRLASGEYAWGKTGSRPGWDNGFFATRDLRHRVVYSLNPTGRGSDLDHVMAIVTAGLSD
ncbi:serine hydrolase domain-containing protein [Lentzea nigeriaca]|uniref:serine hydrolase domain-containing protein n=1 Tax=Lentzea nigeriaca TaxID=1128665 RepID=UPI00195B476A|nr:serine hydrolase domain-containing protein [Lentzea nigeriaca]MBM7858157.1 D-alanyl-D-alanine carboxypeptidase [Lentzea nigeriaca]